MSQAKISFPTPESKLVQKRWKVLSWVTPLVATALVAFLFTASIGQGQAPKIGDKSEKATATFSDAKVKQLVGATAPAARTNAQMICTVSSFFSIDANEQVNDVIHIDGRGLASCKNDQGFTTEVPVSADLTAKAVGNWANAGELSFSMNSAAFVIPREIGQIQDSFTVKPFDLDNDKSTVLMEGSAHDLIIEIKLSSSTEALAKLQVTGMSLRIDENAPTLE